MHCIEFYCSLQRLTPSEYSENTLIVMDHRDCVLLYFLFSLFYTANSMPQEMQCNFITCFMHRRLTGA